MYELAKQLGIAVGFGWVKRRFKEKILNENNAIKPESIEKDRRNSLYAKFYD